MSAFRRSLVALPALLLPACAFLLDFDELQRGRDAKDGGTDGAGAGGGSGDSGQCPERCDDSDPCTTDECGAAGCTHAYTTGVFPDGLSETVSGEAFHRVTLATKGDRIYLSTFASKGSMHETSLYAFARDATALGSAIALPPALNTSGAHPVSVASLASKDAALDVVGYLAVGPAPGQPAKVVRIVFDTNLQLKSAAAASADANYVGDVHASPVAWTPGGGDVVGAWPATGGGVHVQSGTAQLPAGQPPALGRVGTQVTSVAPLVSGTAPAVAYAADEIYSQAVGQPAPAALGQCDSRGGALGSVVSAFTGIENLWEIGWTKALTNGTVTEFLPVVCGAFQGIPVCAGSPTCSANGEVLPSVRNPAMSFVTVDGDAAGRVYQVLVLPSVDRAASQATLSLQVTRIDFPAALDASVGALPITTTPVVLSTTALGANSEGPDWPAVTYVAPDRLAIAWIEPGTTGPSAQVRVERHKLCLPK